MKNLINDYKAYLDHIEILSRSISKGQKEKLKAILSSQLTLLISLKRESNLGQISLSWFDNKKI